eukprot:g9256.t1
MADNKVIVAAIAGACIGGAIVGVFSKYLFRNKDDSVNVKYIYSRDNDIISSPRSSGGDWITEEIKPPLPEVVVGLLNACSLCYLSTSNLQSKAHLSLMTFTYVQSHEVLVLSTRKDTLKLKNLLESPQVAILVHDFPHLQKSKKQDYGNTYSITLYGTTRIAEGDEAKFFRGKHLEHNPKSKVFIEGQNIAIVLVNLTSARICNAADKVQTWNVDS